MNRTTALTITLLLIAAAACSPAPTAAPQATQPPPTPTQQPTSTAVPTHTPPPPPTHTPIPTPTQPPLPDPLPLEGTGENVVDLDWPCGTPGLLHIIGNQESRHFAVESLDAVGDTVELLVNTTDPYDGWRTLNWTDECAVRLHIKAAGPWTATLYPIAPLPEIQPHALTLPATYAGTGDDVIILTQGTPDLATITGNDNSRYFGVFAWIGSRSSDSILINTTDPYQGTIPLKPDTFALEIRASGPWTIDITAK